jgi:protein TonB
MLLKPDPATLPRPRLLRWVAASGALHLLLLAALLHTRRVWVAPALLPGDRNGHLTLLTYAPGHSAAPAALATRQHPAPKPPAPSHVTLTAPVLTAAAPSAPASASTSADSGVTSDALGSGNVTVAMVVSHPPPRPDLSQLPAGTRGDVIVDVVIDATGHIVKSTMASGLGHGVDETVLATIQQWTFQPATCNGVPVASEQELLFHYERHG